MMERMFRLVFFSECHKCQSPYFYEGKEYNGCTEEDSKKPWCPTAIAKDNTTIKNAWQYCDDNSTKSCLVGLTSVKDKTCKTRESLELLVDTYLDLSKISPKFAAEELYVIGCPFDCNYREYSASLEVKKKDQTVDEDHLQLSFELPEDSDTSENLQKDLDYPVTMFIADLGNGFGFLLGLSLQGAIKIFVQSVVLLAKTIFGSEKHKLSNWEKVLSLYIVVKWLTAAGFVTYLTITSLAQDFSDLKPFQQLSLQPATHSSKSNFLNPNLENSGLLWGFSSGDKSISCPYQTEVGDGFCDDKANTEECEYDGGDCCSPIFKNRPNAHWFCSNCTCHLAQNGKIHEFPVLKSGT